MLFFNVSRYYLYIYEGSNVIRAIVFSVTRKIIIAALYASAFVNKCDEAFQ